VLPSIGATDVTERVLWERWGEHYCILLGHDPGEIHDVTPLLRAYEIRGEPGFSWWIVGEVTTDRTTTAQHIAVLDAELKRLGMRQSWRYDEERQVWTQRRDADEMPPLAVGDPWVSGDTHPDRSVAVAFRNAGIPMRPAAYAKGGTGPAMIKKEARIDLVNSLFASGRLVFAADGRGGAVARRTLHSAEDSLRNAAGKPEADRKGPRDPSHWMAAVGYALWPHERLTPIRRANSAR
jgi:hypothetical protein